MNSATDRSTSTAGFDVAIVGVGCRLPGGGNSPQALWDLLCNGVDAVTEVPADRWNSRVFYNPDAAKPGKTVNRWGGFVDRIDHFDAQFFGISPREAARIDPQQRLLLEVAWEALEDGGQVPEQLAGTDVGVFVGISTYDYGEIQHGMNDRDFLDAHSNTGGALSIAANRISYVFDFKGPSMAVDTACSSSLVATHLALRGLQNGECSVALVGGVNAVLKPESTIGFSRASMLSPDGRCKAFDASANGYTRGEGAGVIVLKPLAKALADGDPIYAVIQGSAVNQDGHTSGMTVPGRTAQETMLREAYRTAGISPAQVRYVEAHGTGTPVGDPIETQALGTVLSTDRPADDTCVIGSIKTNIGHLEAAAGIAGLIKAALVLKHGVVPPNLHFRNPNPDIPFGELQLRVAQTLEPLPKGEGPAYAGVNSFGFGGTNAHIVLQEPPLVSAGDQNQNVPGSDRAYLLPMSARDPQALRALAQSYRNFLIGAGPGADVPPHDLCYTASLRRSHHDYRLALVGRSPEEFAEHLEAFLAEESRPGMSSGRPTGDSHSKLVFVFSGMGPQWWAMGRQLLEEEPLFRKAIEQCDELFRQHAGWSLLDELTADESQSRMAETEVAQPANFALQVALAALWRSWGIEPDAIVGHSAGEVAAAYVAGALSLPEAVRVIFHRSRLQQKTSGTGKMAAVGLSLEETKQILDEYQGRVSIAAINSPTAITISGDADALAEIGRSLEQRNVFYRLLRVEVPYHSPQMESIKEELFQSLHGLETRPTAIPLFSTVTGAQVEGPELDAGYWWRNVREPVFFAAAVDQLIEHESEIFLELSPHPVLAGSISECLLHQKKKGAVLPSLRRQEPERAMMLGSLGALYTLGCPVAWDSLYPEGGRHVRLPSYPWQWERYWQESTVSEESRLARWVHPLLGRRMASAQPVWEQDLDRHILSYMNDHQIQGTVVCPGAAYVEMALAVAREIHGDAPCVLEEVEFQKALFLTDDVPPQLQITFSPESSLFQIHSRPKLSDRPWARHAVGKIQQGGSGTVPRVSLEKFRQRCTEDVTEVCYPKLKRHGLEVGPTFQNIDMLWLGKREALSQLRLHETLAEEFQEYQFHPAFLDACFQVLIGTLLNEIPDSEDDITYLPVRIDRLRLYGRPDTRLWCHAQLNELNDDYLEGDIEAFDENGKVVVEIRGFRCQAVEKARATVSENVDDWLYEFRWQPAPQAEQESEAAFAFQQNQESWLVFTDRKIGHQLADLLSAYGHRPILVSPGEEFHQIDERHFQVAPERPDDFHKLLATIGSQQATCRGVVHLWGLDTPADDPDPDLLRSAQIDGSISVLHLVQALDKVDWSQSPHLWLVTRGTQPVDETAEPLAVAQSPLWGLGRVIANEYPNLHCKMVDLSVTETPLEIRYLFDELWTNDGEEEIALREDARYVRRLNPISTADAEQQEKVKAAKDQPFYLDNSKPGVLDNLTLRETTRQQPGPGEVEIKVHAAALNFMDVMKAMGLYPADDVSETLWLGSECAGTIVAVGDGVTDFAVGDDVIALAPGCFRSFVTVDANLVVSKPAHLSFEEATTIPLVFLTSYYSLHHLGRIRKGDWVLIHSATGGVGLSSIQIAQQAGAEIFATAGNPEKRDLLRSLGVKYVMDSRSLAFADEIMEYTDGEGVDIVLNSLAGEAIPKSISVLRAYGRFLEIGKRDIYQNSKLGLRPFRDNLSFHAIDISRLCQGRPAVAGEFLRELIQYFDDGSFQPLPHRVFPISEAVSAFRYMAQAKHIGKIVLSMQDEDVWIVPAPKQIVPFGADATYLIAGGLNGFGLAVAQWMVENGARHLVLASRSGRPSAETAPIVEAMEEAGARIVTAQVDVTQERQVTDLIADVERTMPPLRGVVHAASVYDDAFLYQLNQERFETVMAPKVIGAWNLHRQTLDAPLDFFVLFSSFTSMVGNPGQANYVAANAFLDALAHHRRAQNLTALTINWGAIGEVGYLARHTDIAEHFERQGLKAFTPEQAMKAMVELLQKELTQVGVIDIDWQKWGRFAPEVARSPRFAHLVRVDDQEQGADAQRGKGSVLSALIAASPEERHQILVERLSEQIARVLGTSASKLDVERPLTDFGLDSIMAVELSHWLGDQLGVDLPTMVLIQTPSIQRLADEILEDLVPSAPTPVKVDVEQPSLASD